MLTRLDGRLRRSHDPIRVLYPGLALPQGDSGFATLGRSDDITLPLSPWAFRRSKLSP